MPSSGSFGNPAIAAALLLCLTGYTLAQEPAATLLLKEGTEVKLKVAEEVTSLTAVVDDPITLLLDEDLKVNDVVVVKAGTKGYAVVSSVTKAGSMGKNGELKLRLEYLRVNGVANGVKVLLRGPDQTTSFASAPASNPAARLKKGADVEIHRGLLLNAFVAADVALAPAK
jgi:hypothetical protein